MVSDSSKIICIKRATNNIQIRTKKWWLRHPDQPTRIAIVDTNIYRFTPENPVIFCGILREVNEKGLKEEGTLYFTPGRRRVWGELVDNPIQYDAEDGSTYWESNFIDWTLPDSMCADVQRAIVAISGMRDEELARLLKVTTVTVKNWYTGKTAMPTKDIEKILNKFLK